MAEHFLEVDQLLSARHCTENEVSPFTRPFVEKPASQVYSRSVSKTAFISGTVA
jgi:hypothetical protein